MIDPIDADPKKEAEAVLAFARQHLGPACERLLLEPTRLAAVIQRVRDGRELEDAVLGVVHQAAAQDRAVADEFLSWFLLDLHRIGRSFLAPGLQRYLDSGDLVQSVLGDLWPRLAGARFEDRKRFLAFLSNGLRWKAADWARRLGSARRGEDHRVALPPEELPLTAGGASPATQAGASEERERLILILARLPERDRELLRLHLQGRTLREIGTATGLSEDAARKAVQAAIARARSLAG